MNDDSASARQAAAAALAAGTGGAPVVARLERAGAFTARGPDAGAFLHGQLAADITSLTPGRSRRSLLLNHRGHALAEAVVARDAAEWLIVVDDAMADWVGDTLAQHIIFDDVDLARVAAVATLTVQGTGALAVLQSALPNVGLAEALAVGDAERGGAAWRGVHTDSGADLVIYSRTRSAAGGFDLALLGAARSRVGEDAVDQHEVAALLTAARQLEESLVAAGAVSVGEAAIDAARLAAGVATAGRDGGAGVLPQEAGLTAALSYRKGCYLGQEVMARIEARGNLKRGLVTVELTPQDEAQEGSREITLAGKTVGLLGTAAVMPDGRKLALAVLRSDLAADAALSVAGHEVHVLGPAPLWNAS